MTQFKQSKLVVKDTSLKQFLRLFEPHDYIQLIELGDTLHPSSGFVDEQLLEGCKTVQDVINFDYDFKGLVLFEAIIGDFKIHYSDLENYNITASEKSIERLSRKIEAFNMDSNDFKFEIISEAQL